MFTGLFLALTLSSGQVAPAQASTAMTETTAAIAAAPGPADCVKALQAFVPKRQQELWPRRRVLAVFVRTLIFSAMISFIPRSAD